MDENSSGGCSSQGGRYNSQEQPVGGGGVVKSGGDTMKRSAARVKQFIESYFYQLIDGCGNSNCQNEYCASSGKVKGLTPDQAAGLAIRLFRQEAVLCLGAGAGRLRAGGGSSMGPDTFGFRAEEGEGAPKVARTEQHQQPSARCGQEVERHNATTATANVDNDVQSKSSTSNHHHHEVLNERKLLQVMETCKAENSHLRLIRVLGEVYSSPENLGNSFLKSDSPPAEMLAPSQLATMKKEEVRQLEGEKEKDESSVSADECSGGEGSSNELESTSDHTAVDLESVRRAYSQLFSLFGSIVESALVLALITLSNYIEVDLRMGFVMSPRGGDRLINKQPCSLETLLNALVIALEIPTLGTADYLEVALPKLCRATSYLPLAAQARLARVWSRHSAHTLRSLLEALQQLITHRVIIGSRDFSVQSDEAITAPTKLMKIIYYASMLAGDFDPPELREEDASSNTVEDLPWGQSTKAIKQPTVEDPLADELKVNVLDSRQPLIPFTEFYNEPLSDIVEMDKDFANYKSQRGGDVTSSTSSSADRDAGSFSFMRYSFVLTPATKTLALYYDNRIRMYTERRFSFFQNVVGQPANPYLRLKVRRDHIIDDALVELEMVAMENPKDLKKQLVVEFEGEQGIDEGGVSKEFFQLIVEEIFNPDFSMFTYQQDTRTMWFNTASFESNAQFTLIGIVLGLAIYNNIILDVHFPMVVYKKLMGKRGMYHDLQDFNPTLYNSLKALLEYEGDDMEDTFMQTFRVGYTDVFGSSVTHDLLPNGDQINVTQSNKREFVDRYADFLLNTSIEKQFNAFKKGFQMVTDESPLHLLFRPEEVEQLVCGSKKFDLRELEEATEYDGGYSQDSAVVRHFWEIVHELPLESQRKLLQFATGSDRVPVGGLSKLKLIIAKNGPDSDRLPTAHTCFNVLLLPEYESKNKLYDRLLKAINYSKGFGML
ncbi:ubiquitin-protein ligase E3A isoform X2 [Nilaparvata lugens]|uniref:ubiquitin-protein ligase E3A isoform X2 n=1 Tax=Nilaparvata lugens TaxID=108931 RepID=UPI00193CBE9E|nr:ubiquitin-protein ligase E3A isoform X2 [Nilaparvata lugens]